MGNVIIVGVDGSESAARAAQAAAGLAAGTGATLHVITAYDNRTVEVTMGTDRWEVSSADDAAQTARTVAATLRAITPDIASAAIEGKPHEVLLREAERLDADIIVVGNRRMQGPSRVLGSVANSVAHNAPCDVYIVKTV